jgi:hypothetical protein
VLAGIQRIDDALCAVTFRLDGPALPGPTSVVGDFNDWRPGATKFRHRGGGRHYAKIEVPADTVIRVRYLSDGGVWHNPDNVESYDGPDSVIVVAPTATAKRSTRR